MSIRKITCVEYAKEVHEPLNTINLDIECASCERVLVRSIQIKEIKKPMQYKFICPFCNGKSFLNKFEYQAHFEPIECKITNIEYNEKEKTCLISLN